MRLLTDRYESRVKNDDNAREIESWLMPLKRFSILTRKAELLLVGLVLVWDKRPGSIVVVVEADDNGDFATTDWGFRSIFLVLVALLEGA